MNELLVKEYEIASIYQNDSTKQFLLKSKKDFNKDDCLIEFSADSTSETPTYLTVQINEKEHISLNPQFLQYINHSCNPNVYFDIENYKLIALKTIQKNDELTFFYPSSEWEMIQPFTCFCKNENCLHEIKGAKFLAYTDLMNYRFSKFISKKSKLEVH